MKKITTILLAAGGLLLLAGIFSLFVALKQKDDEIEDILNGDIKEAEDLDEDPDKDIDPDLHKDSIEDTPPDEEKDTENKLKERTINPDMNGSATD